MFSTFFRLFRLFLFNFQKLKKKKLFPLTATKSIEASESTASIPNEKQRYARVNFIGSTEPGSNSYETPILSSEMTSTNAVALTGPIFVSSDTSPFTVIEIANPIDVHVLIGTNGPNQRESEAITRGLDWLVEKRSSDYGWVNDTHMVILAKEVRFDSDFGYIITLLFICQFWLWLLFSVVGRT